MAKFLDVNDADPLLQEIAEKCSFDNLKAADKSMRNDSTMSKIMKSMNLKKNPTIYRRGEQKDIIYPGREGGHSRVIVSQVFVFNFCPSFFANQNVPSIKKYRVQYNICVLFFLLIFVVDDNLN